MNSIVYNDIFQVTDLVRVIESKSSPLPRNVVRAPPHLSNPWLQVNRDFLVCLLLFFFFFRKSYVSFGIWRVENAILSGKVFVKKKRIPTHVILKN